VERTPYEEQQVQAIRAWKAELPGVVTRTFGFVALPAVWLVQHVVPEAAIQGAIDAASRAGSRLADKGDLLREANVQQISDLKNGELATCDALANRVHDWALGLASAEGALTGALGIAGIAADIPAIVTWAFRTIHKIGLCYGYECTSELDTEFVHGVLAASGANTLSDKVAALATLRSIEVTLATQTWSAMAEKAMQHQLSREGGLIAMKRLANVLGVNLSRRKALQTIPAIGAAVGASVNGWYIKDVGWTARRAFQQRWLTDNQKLLTV
jgi:hypothetical protein